MKNNRAGVKKAVNVVPCGVRIVGTGIGIPPKILTNADLEKMVDTSDEWIVQRTGIRERHIVEGDIKTSDLAVEALSNALDDADMAGSELDLIVIASITSDMCCPATACMVADRLGATSCGAMDISMACTGFVAGMNIAANFIRSGMYKNVGVVGAETLSRITNWKDRGTCILFGDGAGAAVFSVSDDTEQGCLYQSLGSDGGMWPELYCPHDESDIPTNGGNIIFNGDFDTLSMNGREIYKFAVVRLRELIEEGVEGAGLNIDDVKVILAHQSNARILESVRGKLGIDEEKMMINIDRYGNTSAASVAICLHEQMLAGSLHKGDIVIFAGLGGGLTWGVSVWRL